MTLVAREVNICLKQLYSHLFTRFVPSTAVPSQYSQSFFKSDNRRQLQWKKNYHISLATDFLHFSFVVPIHTFPQNEFICLYSFASIMSKPAFRLILHVSAVLLYSHHRFYINSHHYCLAIGNLRLPRPNGTRESYL